MPKDQSPQQVVDGFLDELWFVGPFSHNEPALQLVRDFLRQPENEAQLFKLYEGHFQGREVKASDVDFLDAIVLPDREVKCDNISPGYLLLMSEN